MDTSQVWRFPKKYWELFKNISNEDIWKIIRSLFLWGTKDLEWLNKAYYDIIKVDLDNLEKSAINGKKWWRPKKEENEITPGYENKKPQVIENDNLKESESESEEEPKDNIYIELQKILDVWNNQFKNKFELTDNLKEAYLKVRKKYKKEEVSKSLNKYISIALDENYKKYRLSPYSFFTQKNWFINFLNK